MHNIIGKTSLRDYLIIVDQNQLPNYAVTRSEIIAVDDIFGPNLGSLKGNLVCISGNTVTFRK